MRNKKQLGLESLERREVFSVGPIGGEAAMVTDGTSNTGIADGTGVRGVDSADYNIWRESAVAPFDGSDVGLSARNEQPSRSMVTTATDVVMSELGILGQTDGSNWR